MSGAPPLRPPLPLLPCWLLPLPRPLCSRPPPRRRVPPPAILWALAQNITVWFSTLIGCGCVPDCHIVSFSVSHSCCVLVLQNSGTCKTRMKLRAIWGKSHLRLTCACHDLWLTVWHIYNHTRDELEFVPNLVDELIIQWQCAHMLFFLSSLCYQLVSGSLPWWKKHKFFRYFLPDENRRHTPARPRAEDALSASSWGTACAYRTPPCRPPHHPRLSRYLYLYLKKKSEMKQRVPA